MQCFQRKKSGQRTNPAIARQVFYRLDVKMLLNKLRQAGRPGRILLAIAAPVEMRAILFALNSQAKMPAIWQGVEAAGGVDVLHVGVSKANAAGGTARWLAMHPNSYGLVMSIGIAGALPDTEADHEPGGAIKSYRARVGETVVATACDFADEGILTEEGYMDVSEIGFPLDDRYRSTYPCDELALSLITPMVVHRGQITAVSTCSATDELALAIARRTPAICEAMEGAAIALASLRAGVPMIELRAVSNLTGSRTHQGWDIKAALGALERLVRGLNEA